MKSSICDYCGSTINNNDGLIKCTKCNASYCCKECEIDDKMDHNFFCEKFDENTIDIALRFFQIDPENHTPLIDKDGNKYLQFPGELDGDVPKCFLDIHNPNLIGREIWEELDQPIGTLDLWYYLVNYNDLPRAMVRIKKEQMTNLLILLHLCSPKTT